MYEWQREEDGSILIVYITYGNPVEFVGEADRAKWAGVSLLKWYVFKPLLNRNFYSSSKRQQEKKLI